jgi:hypothetical protein
MKEAATKWPALIVGERAATDEAGGVFTLTPRSYTRQRLLRMFPTLFERYVTTNLWGNRADETDPRARAEQIVKLYHPTTDDEQMVIIALGSRVAHAFGVPAKAMWFEEFKTEIAGKSVVIVKFPHTSGRNRNLNDGDFFAKASACLAKYAPKQFTGVDISELDGVTAAAKEKLGAAA